MKQNPSQWTADEIKAKLLTDDVWLIRGLIAIFNYQTAFEQSAEQTQENNSVGFNGVDGYILTAIAKFYQKRNFLSPKQLVIVRKKMVKYAGQLAKIATPKESLESKASQDAMDEMEADFRAERDGEAKIS